MRAWAENIQWLQAQESSAALAINAVISSCGSDPNKPVVALQTYAMPCTFDVGAFIVTVSCASFTPVERISHSSVCGPCHTRVRVCKGQREMRLSTRPKPHCSLSVSPAPRTLAERLKTYVTAVRAQPTQQTNATKLIGAYATVCRSVQAVITKRAKAVEELDYCKLCVMRSDRVDEVFLAVICVLAVSARIFP